MYILELCCHATNLKMFFYFYLFNQTTFYIILSTVGMPLDTTEIDIDLLLQT